MSENFDPIKVLKDYLLNSRPVGYSPQTNTPPVSRAKAVRALQMIRDRWQQGTAWEPVADGELVQPPLSKEGVGIICRRFAPPRWDGEELTEVEVRWTEASDEWQDMILFLPQNYWLCRRVEA